MSQTPSPPPSFNIPQGLVWAALLLGVAAVIGACALFAFVVMPYFAVPSAPSSVLVPALRITPPASPALSPSTASATPMVPAAPIPLETGTSGSVPSGAGSAATPIPGDTLVVEDWSGYRDDADLRAAFSTNDAWADNGITLTLLAAAASPHGPAGVGVAYDIRAAAPQDYVGIERDLTPPQDWRGFTQLVAWAKSTDRSDRQLVLQFHEWSGEVWRHRLRLNRLPADGRVVIPLTPDAWEWADWSERQNKQLDLNEITHFGIFIGHTGPGRGRVELGTLEVRRIP